MISLTLEEVLQLLNNLPVETETGEDLKLQIQNLIQSGLGGEEITISEILLATAKGTAEKDFLDPIPYVNEKGENYLEARTDEIKMNREHMDYTCDDGPFNLLMPQYNRSVEIEDINENFWVLSASLTKIVKLLNIEFNDIYIQINKLSLMSKTKVKLAYSCPFGSYANLAPYKSSDVVSRLYTQNPNEVPDGGTLSLTEYFYFNSTDSKYFGMLPLIEKESINRDGYLYYIPYNKTITNERLSKYTDDELDDIFILDNPSKTGEIIGIERAFGKTPARTLLKMVQSKNFVLVSPQPEGKFPVLDALSVIHNPYLTALQFYRDFIYSVLNLDNGAPFGTLVSNTFTWMQGGYLEFLNFSEPHKWSSQKAIPKNIIDCYVFLNNRFQGTFSNSAFVQAMMSKPLSIGLLRFFLHAQDITITDLITDFYQIYEQLSSFFSLNITNAPYFTDTYGGVYEVQTQTPEVFNQEYKSAVEEYNRVHSVDEVGTYSYIPTAFLFAGKENWFNTESLDKFSIGNKFFNLALHPNHDLSMLSLDNRTVQWDLLSNTFANENFYETENLNYGGGDLERTSMAEYDRRYFTGSPTEVDNLIKDNFNQVAPTTSLLGGWWKRDKPASFGNSYLHPRSNTFGVWFEFIADPTKQGFPALKGEISSFTLNEAYWSWLSLSSSTHLQILQGPVWAAHHIYNAEITIPFSKVANRPYWDFIRAGKPYPNIYQLIQNRKEDGNHLDALNSSKNYISYSEKVPIQKETDDFTYCLDGFYGFEDGLIYPIGEDSTISPTEYSNSPTVLITTGNKTIAAKKIVREREGSSFYGSAMANNLSYEISSTDLVNAYLTSNGASRGGVSEGYTKIINRNEVNNPVVSLSYLSGESVPQQMSIFVSKDATPSAFVKVPTTPPEEVPPETVVINAAGKFLLYDELDSNSLFGLPQTNGNSSSFGFDILGKDIDTLYTNVGSTTADNLDITKDLVFKSYFANGTSHNFYRQKVGPSKQVVGGIRKTQEPANGESVVLNGESFIPFLTESQARVMISSQNPTTSSYYILARTIYNHYSSIDRSPQTSGIYLGYLGFYQPNGSISLIKINRMISAGSICLTCHGDPSVSNTLKKCLFIQESGETHGHIHTFNQSQPVPKWGMTAYGKVETWNNETQKYEATIYLPDIAQLVDRNYPFESFQAIRQQITLEDIERNPNVVYATIHIEGIAKFEGEELEEPVIVVNYHPRGSFNLY